METRESSEQTTLRENTSSTTLIRLALEEKEYQRERSLVVFFITVYPMFIFLILGGNGLVVSLVVWKKKLRTPTNYYITALCVSDITVGVFAVPMDMMEHYNEDYMTTGSCRTVEYLVHVSLAANIFCLVLIAFDRHRSIMRPFKAKQTKRFCATCIGVVWLISFAYGARVIVLYDMTEVSHYHNNEKTLFTYCSIPDSNFSVYKNIVLVDFFVLYVIPLCLICIMYGRISRRLWHERRGHIVTLGSAHTSRHKRKVIRMLLIIVTMFAVCQLPLHVYKMYKYHVGLFPGFLVTYHICDLISFANSWLNVIAYVFFNSNFKSEIKKMLRVERPCFQGSHRQKHKSPDPQGTRIGIPQSRPNPQAHGPEAERDPFVWTVEGVGTSDLNSIGHPEQPKAAVNLDLLSYSRSNVQASNAQCSSVF